MNIETQLTSNLLQVRLAYFLDLMIAISDTKDRDEIRSKLKAKIDKQDLDDQKLKSVLVGKYLLNKTPELIIEFISASIPLFGGNVEKTLKTIYEMVKSAIQGA